MNIERTHGIVDGEAVYHLAAYWDDGDLAIAIQVYPSQPVRWFNGQSSKAEISEVEAVLEAEV